MPPRAAPAGDVQRDLLRPGEQDLREVLLLLAIKLRVRSEVDIGPAGGPVVHARPHPQPSVLVEHDHLTPGPRALAHRPADDGLLVDRARADHSQLLRTDELDEVCDVTLVGCPARPSLWQPFGNDREESGAGVLLLAHWSTFLVSAFSDRALMHPRCHRAIAQPRSMRWMSTMRSARSGGYPGRADRRQG
uniref:Uncharacterized protein n=1 Tax=Janibacter limosus TaxID=53458 RepID=A0AC61U3J8_9MICO|nr:hypothetical protein [Janibacter limosus]